MSRSPCRSSRRTETSFSASRHASMRARRAGVGIRPLELARELADTVGLPLMVHIGTSPPTFDEILALLRPGDILTHCFRTAGEHHIVENGRVREDVIAPPEAGAHPRYWPRHRLVRLRYGGGRTGAGHPAGCDLQRYPPTRRAGADVRYADDALQVPQSRHEPARRDRTRHEPPRCCDAPPGPRHPESRQRGRYRPFPPRGG